MSKLNYMVSGKKFQQILLDNIKHEVIKVNFQIVEDEKEWKKLQENIISVDLSDNAKKGILGLYNSELKTFTIYSTSKIYANQDCSYMFERFTDLEEIDLTNFETTMTNYYIGMFSKCINLKKIDTSLFNPGRGQNFARMFKHCESLEKIDLTNFKFTKAISLEGLFVGCKNLKEIIFDEKVNTRNVKNYRFFICGCESLKFISIKKFTISPCAALDYFASSSPNLVEILVKNKETKARIEEETNKYSNKILVLK